jgi:hypothetical protein
MTAVARGVIVLFDDFYGAVDGVVRAFNGEFCVVKVRMDVERVFKQANVFVERAEKRFDFPGNGDAAFHQAGVRSWCGVCSKVRVMLVSPDRFAVAHRVKIPPEQQLRKQLRLGETPFTVTQAGYGVKVRERN